MTRERIVILTSDSLNVDPANVSKHLLEYLLLYSKPRVIKRSLLSSAIPFSVSDYSLSQEPGRNRTIIFTFTLDSRKKYTKKKPQLSVVLKWRISTREEIKDMPKIEIVLNERKAPPSLVDLCVKTAIDNVRYLGDVGETDLDLLDRILPHCTVDQLMHVEKCSEGRDLSPVTDKLWKKVYEKQFGAKNTEQVVERMAKSLKSYKWIRLYEAKSEDIAEHEKESAARIKQLYKKENARKQSRQVQICTKVPPSKNKRSFYGGSGPGHNVSNLKSNLMKKSKIDFLNSREVKNLAALKKNTYLRNDGASPMMKAAQFSGKGSATTSNLFKPVQRKINRKI